MSVAIRPVLLGNNEETILSVLNQVERCCPAPEGRFDFAELHESIMELEKFVFSFEPDDETAPSILEDLTPEQVARLTDAYSVWETELEARFAHRVIRGEVPVSDYLLYDRFETLLQRELALVRNGPPERILFIGSGPLPVSAIHMHYQTGSPVDCVDRDAGAVEISRQVIEKCGLGDSVRVFCDQGERYDVGEYDLILVALLAKPKKNILRNLRKRSKLDARILCRTSLQLRTLVYEPTDDSAVRGFHIGGLQVAEGEQTISTWLLERAEKAASDVQMRWLRSIDDATADQILRVMNRVLEEETTIGFPDPLDNETGQGLMRQLNDDVRTGRRHVLVAQKDGTIVGQLILTPNQLPNCRHIAELCRGFIDPSFRGAGLSLRAFQEVAAMCEELGTEVLCLDVREGTNAAMWWRHFGFEPYGLLHDYARVGEKRYKGLYMTQTVEALKERLKQLVPDTQTSSHSFSTNGLHR
jgi:GNAT superfamily N-acetyltransferase